MAPVLRQLFRLAAGLLDVSLSSLATAKPPTPEPKAGGSPQTQPPQPPQPPQCRAPGGPLETLQATGVPGRTHEKLSAGAGAGDVGVSVAAGAGAGVGASCRASCSPLAPIAIHPARSAAVSLRVVPAQ